MPFDQGTREAPAEAPAVEKQHGVMGGGAGLMGVMLFMIATVGAVIATGGAFANIRDSITADLENFHINKEKLTWGGILALFGISAASIASMMRSLSRP